MQTEPIKTPALLLLLALSVTTSACAGAEALRRKEGPAYRAETHSWQHLIQRHGRNGDWLVVRGYHRGDDVVAVATNAPLSHAVLFDHDAGEIVEAVGDGVRVAKLGAWHVLHPKDLHRKGALLFDSGSRDGVPDQLPPSSPAAASASDASSTPSATHSGSAGP